MTSLADPPRCQETGMSPAGKRSAYGFGWLEEGLSQAVDW